jgi:two-component sensor histidine kinase
MKRLAWGPLTIRLRLGTALAIALVPVLLLGAAQSVIAFRRDADERRSSLIAGAERSAAVARARLQSAEVLLETLSPATIGLQCAPQLAQVMARSPGFTNLIRFDAAGRVACAAGTVGPDRGRAASAWFSALRAGEPAAIVNAPPGVYAAEPAILEAVRASGPDGRFAGALVGVVKLASLQPDVSDRSLPKGAEVALADRTGRFLIGADGPVLAHPPSGGLAPAAPARAALFRASDIHGEPRVYAVAPLIKDVTVLLSAPDRGLFSWARLNLLSTVLLPLAAFFAALAAVWVVTDRVVVRWLHYLDRIAAIYAKGRLSVRPLQAERAPPEIRALAHSLETMVNAIAERDLSLRDSLAQKDALMREIHHRVKNNLQVITSLINMQQRALSDPAARSALSDTRQRIGALALIYRALYQGPDLKRVDLGSFLEELIAQLVSSEGGRGPSLRTDLQVDELIVDPDKLAPLALFAVEAIANVQKHAFGPAGGSLHVRFTLQGEEASLEISDEGLNDRPVVIGEGVGRTLMTAFARQLRGRADIFENPAGGVTARLVFPNPEAPPPPHDSKEGDEGRSPRPRPPGNQAAA